MAVFQNAKCFKDCITVYLVIPNALLDRLLWPWLATKCFYWTSLQSNKGCFEFSNMDFRFFVAFCPNIGLSCANQTY